MEKNILLEKLSHSANQEIPAFYGTLILITVFRKAHHLMLT